MGEDQYDGYLFTYFAGESYPDGEQVYMAVSRDGFVWQDLNGNRPVLKSHIGQQGVRDPMAIRSKDGSKFWIIATDERIHADHDWKRATTAGSRCILVWESPDLVHWGEPRRVELGVLGAGCVWAPEAIWDPVKGQFLVFWASTLAADGFRKQRVYGAWTLDFRVFTLPTVYMEDELHIIDTTMVEHGGKFYRWSRNDVLNCIHVERRDALTRGVVTRIKAPYLEAQQQVEGPFAFRLNGQHRWVLLLDEHKGRGYYPLVTDDLDSGVYRDPERPYRMPTRARHGGVLPITEAEYRRLVKSLGSSDVA